MTQQRRKAKEVTIKPDYESPADNKYTFRARRGGEFTVIFHELVGEKGREQTAKLLPFFRYIGQFMNESGEADKTKVMEFFEVAANVWKEQNFEREILPAALGLEYGDERMERVGLMDAFMGFMKGLSFVLAGAADEGYQEAEKNLAEEAEEVEE